MYKCKKLYTTHLHFTLCRLISISKKKYKNKINYYAKLFEEKY